MIKTCICCIIHRLALFVRGTGGGELNFSALAPEPRMLPLKQGKQIIQLPRVTLFAKGLSFCPSLPQCCQHCHSVQPHDCDFMEKANPFQHLVCVVFLRNYPWFWTYYGEGLRTTDSLSIKFRLEPTGDLALYAFTVRDVFLDLSLECISGTAVNTGHFPQYPLQKHCSRAQCRKMSPADLRPV